MREFPDSPIAALIDEQPLYNLGESTGPDLTVAEVLGPGGPARIGALSLGYGTSAGQPELRALIAARHGVRADHVLITSGAASALFLLELVCGDGDVVVGLPCFPPVLHALRGLGATVTTVCSAFGDGYRPDLDAFAAALSARTRLVMLASPQNPSGIELTAAEVDQLLAAMSRSCPGAMLLIDETYREATYAGAAPAASFAGRSPRLVTCGSLSKAYGVPGLRVGWLTTSDRALRDQLRLAKFSSAVACGTADEFLAISLLSRADGVLAGRSAVLSRGRTMVATWADELAGRIRWLAPDAGAICSILLEPAVFGPDDVARVHKRLAQERTLVAQGPWFGDSPHVIRLGPAFEPPDHVEAGLAVIAGVLDAEVS
jgi:aspartate/methionine/tyrosine aminotransferase